MLWNRPLAIYLFIVLIENNWNSKFSWNKTEVWAFNKMTTRYDHDGNGSPIRYRKQVWFSFLPTESNCMDSRAGRFNQIQILNDRSKRLDSPRSCGQYSIKPSTFNTLNHVETLNYNQNNHSTPLPSLFEKSVCFFF